MPTLKQYKTDAINLELSPLLNEGQVLSALNVKRDTYGGWKKREGYVTYLGTPDNAQVNTLSSWLRNDGTSLYVYRASGSILYHSIQGTGAWTVSGNGTITNGGHFGHAILDDVLIGGDGSTASRHTTNGTGFTNTTAAPLAELWTEYQGRVWATRGTATSGTNTDNFYSTAGTATDWTTDSSSIRTPGAGRNNGLFKSADRLITSKDAGNIFRYDGFSQTDLATDLGVSSPYSIGNIEDYRIYLNRSGFMGFSGGKPQVISNPIRRLIYNDSGSAIAGTTFGNAPGIANRFHYYCSVGTVTDDLIGKTTPDCVLRYDIQYDEWVTWQFANRPTAFGTYQDVSGNRQMIFGDANGQCYQMAGTATSDNGQPIESGLIGFVHGNSLEDKDWRYIKGLFNPGCGAVISFAISDTFTPQTLNWETVGDAKDGIVEHRFPSGTRGVFLFWRILESGVGQPWQFYAWEYEAEAVKHD